MRCVAEISVLVHATEDLDKVVESLRRFFGDLPYVIQKLEGHYGNPIYLITALQPDCARLLERLCPAVSKAQQEGEWFVRLDKQRLVRGEVALSNSDDVVRIRIKGGRCGG
ncbi:MAG: RNA-binding domain-containing protein [Thermoproteus sp.]